MAPTPQPGLAGTRLFSLPSGILPAWLWLSWPSAVVFPLEESTRGRQSFCWLFWSAWLGLKPTKQFLSPVFPSCLAWKHSELVREKQAVAGFREPSWTSKGGDKWAGMEKADRVQTALSISEKQTSNNHSNHIKELHKRKRNFIDLQEKGTLLGVANATGQKRTARKR